jgi:hypothetical protein
MRHASWVLVVALAACGAPSADARDAGAEDAHDAAAAPDTRVVTDAFVAIDGAPCLSPDAATDAPDVRLVAPLSSARTTSLRPTFRWRNATALPATLEICADRACTVPITSVDTPDEQAQPASDLPAGVAYWRVAIAPPGATRVTSATWSVRIPHRGAAIDTSWGSVLDLDGNGHVDLAAPGNARLYVYMSSSGAFPRGPTRRLPDAAPADAGDVNGDGYADLLAGNLYLGSAAGVVDTGLPIRSRLAVGAGDVDGDGYADVVAPNGAMLDVYFGGADGLGCGPGQSLAIAGSTRTFDRALSLGDLDSDGYADVAAVTWANTVGDRSVTVWYGSASGLGRASTLAVPATSISFASSISGAGDLNGDGYADVAIAAPSGGEGVYGNGAVYVYYGGPSGIATTPSQRILAPNPAMGTPVSFGRTVGIVGDLNADGFDDLAVDESGTTGEQGGVYVYSGGATGLASPFVIHRGMYGFADVLGSARDMDGDGIDDLVVGSPEEPPVGAVLFFPGSTSGVATTPSVTLTCPDTGWYGRIFA